MCAKRCRRLLHRTYTISVVDGDASTARLDTWCLDDEEQENASYRPYNEMTLDTHRVKSFVFHAIVSLPRWSTGASVDDEAPGVCFTLR